MRKIFLEKRVDVKNPEQNLGFPKNNLIGPIMLDCIWGVVGCLWFFIYFLIWVYDFDIHLSFGF